MACEEEDDRDTEETAPPVVEAVRHRDRDALLLSVVEEAKISSEEARSLTYGSF